MAYFGRLRSVDSAVLYGQAICCKRWGLQVSSDLFLTLALGYVHVLSGHYSVAVVGLNR